MSDSGRRHEERGCGGDVAAYALGALDPAEAVAFRQHLEACAICRDELAAFEAVVEALPLSVPAHHAPSSLRRRVLREVSSGRPAAGGELPRRFGGRRASRSRSRVPAWLRLRPAMALGATLATVAIAAVVVSLDLGSSSSSPARVLQAQVVGPGSAQLRIAGGRASLVVHRFPSPPPGKIYELWLQHGNRAPSPAGLFSVTAGSADVGVPGSLHGVTHVMVTPEPSGGSQVPTHAPVITVTLA